MLNRRGFLGSAVALPFAVKALAVPQQGYILYADGVHDDTTALQAWFDGKPVRWPDGSAVNERVLERHKFRLSGWLDVSVWVQRTDPGSFSYNFLHLTDDFK
jgi:hypothetical protein